MMMGPDPINRIFLMSVRFGIARVGTRGFGANSEYFMNRGRRDQASHPDVSKSGSEWHRPGVPVAHPRCCFGEDSLMLRQLSRLAALLALAVGCSQNKPTGPGGPTPGGGPIASAGAWC